MDFKQTIDFFSRLKENNNREWFHANKAEYDKLRKNFLLYTELLIQQISEFDQRLKGTQAKDCLFRIYRDIRFSKNKIPYKTHIGAYMSPGGRKSIYAGYYLHIEPEESFLGGGIYCPQNNILKAIRTEIYNNVDAFYELKSRVKFKEYFGDFQGEKLKTAPRDFPKDWEHIETLRNKSYFVWNNITDDLFSPDLNTKILEIFREAYHVNEYFNQTIDEFSNKMQK